MPDRTPITITGRLDIHIWAKSIEHATERLYDLMTQTLHEDFGTFDFLAPAIAESISTRAAGLRGKWWSPDFRYDRISGTISWTNRARAAGGWREMSLEYSSLSPFGEESPSPQDSESGKPAPVFDDVVTMEPKKTKRQKSKRRKTRRKMRDALSKLRGKKKRVVKPRRSKKSEPKTRRKKR